MSASGSLSKWQDSANSCLRRERASVNEVKYLGTQICHHCLSCKTVDLLLVNATALTETFAHMET